MTHNDPSEGMSMVVGASRGLGREIANALAQAGSRVVAVARSQRALAELAEAAGGIHAEAADATDPTAAGSLLDRYDPCSLVLVAGAGPPGPPVSPDVAGSAVLELLQADPATLASAYVLAGDGLKPLP